MGRGDLGQDTRGVQESHSFLALLKLTCSLQEVQSVMKPSRWWSPAILQNPYYTMIMEQTTAPTAVIDPNAVKIFISFPSTPIWNFP